MSERKRILMLISIMAVSALTVAAVTMHVLYRAAYKEEQTRLVETAQSQARLIEAIARFHHTQGKDHPEYRHPVDATLSQIRDAHRHYVGFGQTGEFTLAYRGGDWIQFLLRHRHGDMDNPKPIPFDSELAEPMRRALIGKSGIIEAPDYRGKTVLAAHEPVAELNFGIVAKIDLDEVKKPFFKAGALALGFTLLVVLTGTAFFFRISNPMLRKISENETQYRNLFDHLKSGVAIYEKTEKGDDFIVKDINHAGESICNVKKEDILERRITEAFPAVKEFGLFELLQEVSSTGKSFHLPITLYQDDRMSFWAENYVYRLPEGQIVAVFDDMTGQKKAEESLRESHETLLAVLDSIDATIYVADMTTYKILFMNKYMRDTFGRDMVGGICWRDFRNEPGPCPNCSNNRLIDSKGNPTGVYVWEGKNPLTQKWYINHDRAIRWADGRHVRLQVAFDITPMKKLEEERRKAESQLIQVQKMESIGTLAGGIAHDFNNILGIIIGNTELAMLDLSGTESVAQNLAEIHTASLRAKDLVKQILTFSRQSEQEMIPLKIEPIVKEVLKMLRATLPATIGFNQIIEPESGTIVADPTQIHQILMNLCSNASYSMRERGGTLTIRLENIDLSSEQANLYPELGPGRYVSLTIADTGTGIDPLIIERIFDPYFTTKPLNEGTGMGLAVVHGIVRRCGGAIDVKSAIGKGTSFTLLFPRIRRIAAIERQEMEVLPTGHETILFVDDEEALVEMGIFMLNRLGYRVIGKTESIEALEAFRNGPKDFDLIITDQTMPGLTGKELSEQLMAIRPDIPIILCTGFSEVINEEKARAIGIREFIMKPVVITDLARVIRRTLDGIPE